MTRQVHLCSCNRTMPFDATAFASAAASAGAASVQSFDAMCQRELARFGEVIEGDAVVACTQESRLLGEAASDSPKVSTVRFFNIREKAGWSKDASFATPKIAALIAEAMLPGGAWLQSKARGGWPCIPRLEALITRSRHPSRSSKAKSVGAAKTAIGAT